METSLVLDRPNGQEWALRGYAWEPGYEEFKEFVDPKKAIDWLQNVRKWCQFGSMELDITLEDRFGIHTIWVKDRHSEELNEKLFTLVPKATGTRVLAVEYTT